MYLYAVLSPEDSILVFAVPTNVCHQYVVFTNLFPIKPRSKPRYVKMSTLVKVIANSMIQNLLSESHTADTSSRVLLKKQILIEG